MGLLDRRAFDLGWVPDADAVGCPPNGCLRFDNLRLDVRDVPTLRLGSSKINAVALADLDVHSLYTTYLSGTRYRMAGVNNNIYANGAVITGAGTTGDAIFGSYQGQILIGRESNRKKYDGATVRNWGVPTPTVTPTITALAPDGKTLSTCDLAEAPGFGAVGAAWEGTQAYVIGQDNATANGAIQLTPSATTGRGAIRKVFAGETDFTTYDAGETATENDLLQLYVYVTDPTLLLGFTIMVDVNGSSVAPFQNDYYSYDVTNATVVDLTAQTQTPSNILSGHARKNLNDAQIAAGIDPPLASPEPPATQLRPDAPVGNSGWNLVQIPRHQFTRVGSTSGKGWNTVKTLQIVVQTVGGGAAALVGFDTIRLAGGNLRPLTGAYQWICVYAYNSGTYVGLSAPSAPSAITTMLVNGATVQSPGEARDTQINEIWLFRFGGILDQFYRVAVATGVSGNAAVSITDTLNDADALTANIKLQIDNAVPPSSTLLDIVGPYFDRVFLLTKTDLYPSRQLNPDSFAASQVLHIAGPDETGLWCRKALGGLYVGTTKDIYRVDGDGTELPNDTINLKLTPLNIDHPPIINTAGDRSPVAQDGNLLIYLADDGWRSMAGEGSSSLVANTSLLYKGETRHGVSPVNLASGRFRAAIAKGRLVCLTPEGASTTSSSVLYRLWPQRQLWFRNTYTPAFRVVYREPDGTLIAGDTAGFVWILDTGTQDDSNNIPVTFWSRVDDDSLPYQRKDPLDHRLVVDTGGATATLNVHLDNSGSAAYSPTFSNATLATYLATLAGQGSMATFRQIQYRLTVTTAAFRLVEYGINYRERPPLQTYAENKPLLPSPARRRFAGMKLVLDTLGQNATVTPLLDNVAGTPWTVNTADALAVTQTFVASIGRDLSAKVSCPTGFELYQIEQHIIETFPAITWGRLPSTNAGWPGRKRMSGLEVKFCSLGVARILTPIIDGVVYGTSYTITTNSNNPETHLLQFAAPVFGTDITFSSNGDIETYEVSPQVELQIPVPTQGRLPPTNVGYAGPKVMAGIELKLCTIGVPRVITVYLDGVAQSATYSFTTDTNEPETKIIKFATPLTATDIAIGSDGDIELYGEIQPQVLYTLPVGIYAWENIPLKRSEVRRRFGGFSLHLNTNGVPVSVIPVLDGIDQPALSVTTSALLSTVATIDAIVGRDLWCRIIATSPMQVLAVDSIILETFPQQFKGTTPRSKFGDDSVKSVSGYQLRICTLGVPRTLTPIVDGVAQTDAAVSIMSGEDDPIDVTVPFLEVTEGVEFSFDIDDNVEVWSWSPIITNRRPLGVRVYDSGPIDIGRRERTWFRTIRFKVRAGGPLDITVWFDGHAYPTVTSNPETGVDTIVTLQVGRGYVGKQPRLVIASAASFYPYWIECWVRDSGSVTDKTIKRVPLPLQVRA
jgi:hypothetical protein